MRLLGRGKSIRSWDDLNHPVKRGDLNYTPDATRQ